MGPGRFTWSHEATTLMGQHIRGPYSTARRYMDEEALWRAQCDSVDKRMMLVLVSNGVEMAGWDDSEPIAVISAFSGALDPSVEALSEVTGAPVRLAAIMESDKERRNALAEHYSVPQTYADAHKAAARIVAPAEGRTVLVATPSCKLLSSAPHCTTTKANQRRKAARKQMNRDVATVLAIAERCKPELIILEQTDALLTRNKEAYTDVRRALENAPYVWRHSVVDAEAIGSSHRRKRAGWVGKRVPHEIPS